MEKVEKKYLPRRSLKEDQRVKSQKGGCNENEKHKKKKNYLLKQLKRISEGGKARKVNESKIRKMQQKKVEQISLPTKELERILKMQLRFPLYYYNYILFKM